MLRIPSKWLIKPQSIFLLCWILKSFYCCYVEGFCFADPLHGAANVLCYSEFEFCLFVFIVAFLTPDYTLLVMMQESNYLRQEKSFLLFLIKIPTYIPFLQPVLWSEMFSCVWELDWDLRLHSCISTQDQSNKFTVCYGSFLHGAMWNIKQISFVFS